MPCVTPLKVLTIAEGAHWCHLVRFPDEVRRDRPHPASGVAAVGHNIAESTVGIGTRPTAESNVAHNFAMFRDTTAGNLCAGEHGHLQRTLDSVPRSASLASLGT